MWRRARPHAYMFNPETQEVEERLCNHVVKHVIRYGWELKNKWRNTSSAMDGSCTICATAIHKPKSKMTLQSCHSQCKRKMAHSAIHNKKHAALNCHPSTTNSANACRPNRAWQHRQRSPWARPSPRNAEHGHPCSASSPTEFGARRPMTIASEMSLPISTRTA